MYQEDPTKPRHWLDDCRRPALNSSRETTEHFAQLRAARKAQRADVAVAPGASFTGPNNRAYNSGEELDENSFVGFELKKLEELHLIIRLTPEERLAVASIGARFRVAEGQAILTREGILTEGCALTEAHFEAGLARIKELCERGVISETPEGARR